MKIPKQSDLNSSNCTERSMNIHYPEFADYLRETYKREGLKWTERLYLYYHNLTERPVCVVCGKPVKFYNMNIGYARTCSHKCNGADPLTREKVRKTSLKKFGVENAAQSKQVKEKAVKTCMERYGLTNGGWSKKAQERIKKTNRFRHGVDYPMQNENIKRKAIETNKRKYGVLHNSQIPGVKAHKEQVFMERYGGVGWASPELKNKALETTSKRFGAPYKISNTSQIPQISRKISQSLKNRAILSHPDLISHTENGEWICKCPHNNCNKCVDRYYITTPSTQNNRMRIGAELCTNLLPVQSLHSNFELIVCSWLDEVGIEYTTNDRTILPSGLEIDIYIPSLKIGIECNGVFWHSTKFKTNAYHLNKTKEATNIGIRLYHVWEDWVANVPDIIKSMVLNWVGKSVNKIYARKCVVKEVVGTIGMNFLEHNHIQGRSPYQVGYGLYYNGQLVSLMTFGKKRGCVGNSKDKGSEGEWELIRFCSLLNTSVIGAAGKLLKHFTQQHQPTTIYSYASCDISVGGVYNTLGFKSDGKVTQSYWYIEPNTFKRYHRSSFTKSAIVKRGWKDKIDSSWTEKQVMEEVGYYCIYDAGQTKWVLKKDAENSASFYFDIKIVRNIYVHSLAIFPNSKSLYKYRNTF